MRLLNGGGSLVLGLVLLSAPACASMRCDGGIVTEGMGVDGVLEMCGQPATRAIDEPGVDDDGFMLQGAARVERWQYGPDRGMYRTLRFIDGRLVEIRSRRY